MAVEPLIVQVPRGSAVDRQLTDAAPESVVRGAVVVERSPADAEGHLDPPAAGQVVLSVLSPEALRRQADSVTQVIEHAGTGEEPLVVVVEAAEELREDELAVVVEAARQSRRPVILRVIREG